jgi:hypothetical protein
MTPEQVDDVLTVSGILDANLDNARLIAELINWKHSDHNVIEDKPKLKGGRVVKEEVPDDEPGF